MKWSTNVISFVKVNLKVITFVNKKREKKFSFFPQLNTAQKSLSNDFDLFAICELNESRKNLIDCALLTFFSSRRVWYFFGSQVPARLTPSLKWDIKVRIDINFPLRYVISQCTIELSSKSRRRTSTLTQSERTNRMNVEKNLAEFIWDQWEIPVQQAND